MTDQPNILWISTHDINPDLGSYAGVWPGAEYAHTPHLDELARQGVRFDNAFAAAPICAPSRSAILTGCFPTAIGTMHMRTKAVPPPEVHLLPEYFRASGYYCTNNWFTDFQVDTPSVVFDDWGQEAHWRNRPPGTPFFAMFHGMATHESQLYLSDEEFATRTAHVEDRFRHDPGQAPLPPYYPDSEVFHKAWARYADLITEMDHWAGQLLAELDEDGLTESTIVVFWSDHGKGMPRAKRWPNEAGLREPLLVRWPGHLDADSARIDLVHTMDLAPSMLALAGLTVPEHMHGRVLFDGEGGASPNASPFVYGGTDRQGEAEDRSRTVRDSRYRYIRHAHPDRPAMIHTEYPDHLATWAEFREAVAAEAVQLAEGRLPSVLTPLQRSVVAQWKPAEELFDITNDVHETVNLVSDPDHSDALQRLREALDSWETRYRDLGTMAEAELLEGWRPGGTPRITEAPLVSNADGETTISCETPGATIGWTASPPRPTRERTPFERAIGAPEQDGRGWNLLIEGIMPPRDRKVWLRAWRIGFAPSADTVLAPTVPSGPL